MTAPSSASESAAPTPSESPAPAPSTSSQPASSEPAETDEIPAAIHGRWITFSQGEKPRECTAEVEGEGAIITIDATKISSFAFLFELESVKESDASSMVGQFAYHDDSDALLTPEIKLVTKDDWKTLEFIELGTEGQDPAFYSRCA
ncbi:MAG: hypothetical protein ABIS84_14840 [Arachnia sp.]